MREMQTSVAYSRITVRNSCAATLYTHQIGKALGCIVFVYSIGTEVKYANDIHVSLKYIMQFVQVSFFFSFLRQRRGSLDAGHAVTASL